MTLTVELREIRTGTWQAHVPKLPDVAPIEKPNQQAAYYQMAATLLHVLANRIEKGERKVTSVDFRRRIIKRSSSAPRKYSDAEIARMSEGSGFTIREYRELVESNPTTAADTREMRLFAKRVRAGKEKLTYLKL